MAVYLWRNRELLDPRRCVGPVAYGVQMTMSAKMITIDCAEPQELSAWWAAALGLDEAQDYGDFFILGAKPLVLGFQRVPEGKPGKNRVHVDFVSADRTGEVERLIKLGATYVAEQFEQGLAWTTLQDPAGNEFCVCDESPELEGMLQGE